MFAIEKHSSTIPAFRTRRARVGNRGGILAALAALWMVSGCKDTLHPNFEPEVECQPGTVSVDGEPIPVAPNGFAVVGNRIVSVDTCEPHRFLGISRVGLHYSSSDPRLEGESGREEFERIRSWGANVVRITVSQNFWVPTAKWYDPEYPARVDDAVRKAREAGLDVILVLQTSDRGDPSYPGSTNLQQPMPDVNHTVPFWRDVATRYKDDGRILFELFGEPYPYKGTPDPKNRDWDLWLNGGTVAAGEIYGEHRKAYEAVGMQELYDVVRSTGARNMVILSGPQWGYYLDGIPTHRVQGYNIAYAAHPWDWNLKQPSTWDQDWGFLAKTDPVIVSEFGDYSCNQDGYTTQVLDYADRHNLSWMAWAWIAPSPSDPTPQQSICEFPMLLADWSGTPSATGELVRQRLLSY